MKTKKDTDWIRLWGARVAAREAWRRRDPRVPQGDRWQERAAEFARTAPARTAARRRAIELLDQLMVDLPDPTILDIGAGAGVWSAYLARKGGRVTAVEPSPSMRRELERSCSRFLDQQITVRTEPWPDLHVPPHDIVLCAHAMYGTLDFAGWINAMIHCARTTCIVILRAPEPDDFFLNVSRIIAGDGAPPMPDAYVALHALSQMGVTPHVWYEACGAPRHRVYPDLESMLRRVKRECYMPDHLTRHDDTLRDLLKHTAINVTDGLTFPPRPRNAIIFWKKIFPLTGLTRL